MQVPKVALTILKTGEELGDAPRQSQITFKEGLVDTGSEISIFSNASFKTLVETCGMRRSDFVYEGVPVTGIGGQAAVNLCMHPLCSFGLSFHDDGGAEVAIPLAETTSVYIINDVAHKEMPQNQMEGSGLDSEKPQKGTLTVPDQSSGSKQSLLSSFFGNDSPRIVNI